MSHWWPYRLNAHHSTRSVIVRDIKSKQLHVYSGCCPFPEQRWSSLRATAQAVPYPFEGRNLAKPHCGKWRSQPKIFWGAKNLGWMICLILGEQQYFVCVTASQSTKWLDLLKIWGDMVTPGYTCGYSHALVLWTLVQYLQRRLEEP